MSSGKVFAVTGGAGFIGSHLVDRLLSEGASRVYVIDDFSSGALANLDAWKSDDRLVVVKGDVRRRQDLACLREADGVVHLAATKHNPSKSAPDALIETNINGTYNVLEEARRGKAARVLFASSLYVYGVEKPGPFSERSPLLSRTLYGATKIAGENLCRAMAEKSSYRAVVLRYFFIYGPRLYQKNYANSLLPKTLRRTLEGQPPEIFGDGEQTFDYLYIRDAIELTYRALVCEHQAEVLNLCSGTGVTVNQVVSQLCELTGFSGEPISSPPDETAGSVRTGDPSLWKASLKPKALTPLAEGLAESLKWWQQTRQIAAPKQ